MWQKRLNLNMRRARNGAKGKEHVLELGVCALITTNENETINKLEIISLQHPFTNSILLVVN
jgi:hypothetical protein